MPLADHLEYVADSPEEHRGVVRPKQGANRCPECGIPMDGMDPAKHALSHWPARWDPNNPPSAEAIRRRKQLTEPQSDREQPQRWS